MLWVPEISSVRCPESAVSVELPHAKAPTREEPKVLKNSPPARSKIQDRVHTLVLMALAKIHVQHSI